ncbi:hypothetical protein N9B73_00215 [Verrucomicrobiales bacterium]|jgi:hypothetical protein|nr:hypothetical protein [Verrucomicrobiales bacterium]
MKSTLAIMKSTLALVALIGVLGFSTDGMSQIQLSNGDIKVKDIEVEAQPTPLFQAAGVKNKNIPNPKEWLEMEVEFEVKGDEDKVVPELLFRYYAGFRDEKGSVRILTGDVKHINVVPGEEYYSSAYVSPSTLGQITGDYSRFQPSSVAGVGVEIYFNGVIIGGSTSTGTKFWAAGTAPAPGVMGKGETPFALLWIDRYAQAGKK